MGPKPHDGIHAILGGHTNDGNESTFDHLHFRRVLNFFAIHSHQKRQCVLIRQRQAWGPAVCVLMNLNAIPSLIVIDKFSSQMSYHFLANSIAPDLCLIWFELNMFIRFFLPNIFGTQFVFCFLFFFLIFPSLSLLIDYLYLLCWFKTVPTLSF